MTSESSRRFFQEHPVYGRWATMKYRCLNPDRNNYDDYGGRGITVHQAWINDYQAFEDYVLSLPHALEPGYSIDRIDNDGNYEPGNLRWATRSEQQKNKRTIKAMQAELEAYRAKYGPLEVA